MKQSRVNTRSRWQLFPASSPSRVRQRDAGGARSPQVLLQQGRHKDVLRRRRLRLGRRLIGQGRPAPAMPARRDRTQAL